ncbi:MAG: metal-dependent hydrolase [bacterium]|nr:metal-dependent hydrolase [bacterium]
MDSLTHTVLGACLGEVVAGKKLGKKAMLIGALVNNLPDIDMVANFWSSPAQGLLTHRGITHSILFAVVMTPLLILLFKKTLKEDPLSFTRWLVLVGHGLFLHILMDAFTTYGTGWFEPFDHTRVSFNTLFILDPFFMVPLLIAFIFLLLLKNEKHKTRAWFAGTGLSVSALYLLATFGIKLNVNRIIEKEILRNGFVATDYMGSPTPLNTILWYAIVKEEKGFRIGYYSILDKTNTITFEMMDKNDSLLTPYKKSDDVHRLIRFSQDYYCVKETEEGIMFSDIRFGQLGISAKGKPSFVFNFDVIPKLDQSIDVKQSKFKTANSQDLKALYNRIKGI